MTSGAADLSPPLAAQTGRRRRDFVGLAILAVVVTILNAIKPMHIDDAGIYYNALQISHHPLDPYGFDLYILQWPEPANGYMCPPVLPYWWSIAIRLFGQSPLVWKLWMFPWIALFVASVYRLMRRFAGELAMGMTVLVVMSPAFLPAINLMLDVPALAMGLGALCVAMRAIDCGSVSIAAAAGVMAGIAMQTKYTAFVVPALIFIYGLQHRRVLLACFPGAIAATLFIAWESFMHWRYGISHFMYHLGWGDILKGYQPKSVLVEAIVTLIGGLTPAIALLGAAALGLSTFVLVLIGVVAVGGVVLLQAYDAATSIFFVFGIAAWIVTLLVATQLKRRGNRDDIFLLLWLTSEVIAYLAISPFAASRRAMGIVLVMALLASRLASLRTTTGRSLRVVRAIIACGMILGLTVYGLDRTEAMAQRKTVDQLALQLQPVRQPGEKVWFLGHGGFSYYAQRLGFESIVPDHSQLHRGDWLIEPKAGMPVQHVAIPSSAVEYTTAAVVDDPVQLSSLPFYAGLVPVTHRIGPRVAAVVYRVREDFILETTYDDDVLMKWAATRHRPLPPAAVAALVRAAGRSDPASAAATMNAISQSGPEAVAAALELPDARVRMWAANQLASMDPSAKSVLSAIQRAQHDADPSVRAAADRAVQHVAGFVDK